MQGARAFAVAYFSVGAFAVTDECVGAWHGLQHVGEVFRAHGGFLRDDVGFTYDG